MGASSYWGGGKSALLKAIAARAASNQERLGKSQYMASGCDLPVAL
jgi:hypothetical protein